MHFFINYSRLKIQLKENNTWLLLNYGRIPLFLRYLLINFADLLLSTTKLPVFLVYQTVVGHYLQQNKEYLLLNQDRLI